MSLNFADVAKRASEVQPTIHNFNYKHLHCYHLARQIYMVIELLIMIYLLLPLLLVSQFKTSCIVLLRDRKSVV